MLVPFRSAIYHYPYGYWYSTEQNGMSVNFILSMTQSPLLFLLFCKPKISWVRESVVLILSTRQICLGLWKLMGATQSMEVWLYLALEKAKKNKAPGFRDLNWLFLWLIVICLLISLELIVIHWLYCGCPSKSKRHLCSFTYMAKTFYLNVKQAQGATGHHHQRKLITSIPPQYWSELLSCFILHVHIMYKYLLKF